jgi:predicted RNA-binding Zn-ribbon protein involved in translation (DUF1610 family)
MNPKILLYDLEISPMLAYVYDMWDTNVLKVEKQAEIMSISWKWLGDKKIHNLNQTDMTTEYLIKQLWKLLDEANVVIAHNANKFDNKVSNAMFLRYNMTPPSPYRTIDTLTVARSKFKFNANSLDNLGEVLGIGRKTNDKHSDLWYDCIKGDKKAWKKMALYNDNDVILLEKLYLKLRPYISNHPNIAVLSNKPDSCPKCGGIHIQRRGIRHTNAGAMQRYKCMDCGGWCSERVKEEDIERSTYVNY